MGRFAGSAHMEPEFAALYRGGIGAFLISRYSDSDVGPYDECLVVPGGFRNGRRRFLHIPTIYVSSQASVEAGRRNWGIPKQLASFSFDKSGSTERVTVRQGAHTIVDVNIATGRVPFPVSSKLIPKSMRRFVQRGDDGLLEVVPTARGWVRMARLVSAESDAEHFADMSRFSPLLATAADFTMTFPEASAVDLPTSELTGPSIPPRGQLGPVPDEATD